MNAGLFKMIPTNYSFINYVDLIYMYNEDLTLNNLQGLIYHKTQANQILYI